MHKILILVLALFFICCKDSKNSEKVEEPLPKEKPTENTEATIPSNSDNFSNETTEEELTDEKSNKVVFTNVFKALNQRDTLETYAEGSIENSTEDSLEKQDVVVDQVNTDENKSISSTTNTEIKQSKEDVTTNTTKDVEIKEAIPEIIRPEHDTWNTLTKKYVSSNGKVNYKGFKSEIKLLESYLTHLEKTPPKKGWSRSEQLAYWFNLYNAATIQLISTAYPVKSIKDINSGKPWDKVFIKSGDKKYSLNQIENAIVRPNFNEPRLHVAFNCAAISCPKMLNQAFVPNRLNSQLNKLSKDWINDSSKNKITENTIEISKIFEWYAKDFKKGVLPFINKYSGTTISDDASIAYLEYNWDLND